MSDKSARGQGGWEADKSHVKETGFGLTPYVIGAAIGVAGALLGSWLFDKTATSENAHVYPSQAGSCRSGNCAICLNVTEATEPTPCCRQLLHVDCYNELKSHRPANCPLCRARW